MADTISDKAVNHYNMAGLFLIISGILHLPMFLVGGINGKTITMLVFGLVWIALGIGLRRQIKILPYIVYPLMLFGVVASMTGLNAGPVPNWWWWLIFFADLLAAIFLFRLIWSKP